MARITLSKNTGFTLVPEGIHVFKIVKVDESKYEKFGKLEVTLETASGQTHTERFSLLDTKGEVNEKALNAFTYFARTALNDYRADDIDAQELVGCFIRAEVTHVVSDKINEKTGKPYVNVNLGDKEPALGFDGDADESQDSGESDDELEEL